MTALSMAASGYLATEEAYSSVAAHHCVTIITNS
jgi:hypothetical protein